MGRRMTIESADSTKLKSDMATDMGEKRSHQVAASLNFLLVGYSNDGTLDLSVSVDLHLGITSLKSKW